MVYVPRSTAISAYAPLISIPTGRATAAFLLGLGVDVVDPDAVTPGRYAFGMSVGSLHCFTEHFGFLYCCWLLSQDPFTCLRVPDARGDEDNHPPVGGHGVEVGILSGLSYSCKEFPERFFVCLLLVAVKECVIICMVVVFLSHTIVIIT